MMQKMLERINERLAWLLGAPAGSWRELITIVVVTVLVLGFLALVVYLELTGAI